MVDDIIIIVNEKLQRHDWKMGCMVPIAGTESHVRRVDILRSDGKLVMKEKFNGFHRVFPKPTLRIRLTLFVPF